MTSQPSPTGSPSTQRRPGLAATVGLYALARLALVAVIAGLLMFAGVPLLIALLVGLIVALPLSMVLFRGLRSRLDGTLAQVRDRRAQEREVLRARLRGDTDAAGSGIGGDAEGGAGAPDPAAGADRSDVTAERESDSGQD